MSIRTSRVSHDRTKAHSIWMAGSDDSTENGGPYDSFPCRNSELDDNAVYGYFENKNIMELFAFMVQHLIINEPDNPILYLKDLVDRLLLWRSGTVSWAPHLFERRHVEAVYRALDPTCLGSIPLELYYKGVKIIIQKHSCLFPELGMNAMVDKNVFITNVMKGLDNELMSLVKPPYTELCGLTILPDSSLYEGIYDPPKVKKERKVGHSKEKEDECEIESAEEDSCGKSCVILQTAVEKGEDQDDQLSTCSTHDCQYDFLSVKTEEDSLKSNTQLHFKSGRGTLYASQITVLQGQTGENAKMVLAEKISLKKGSLVKV